MNTLPPKNPVNKRNKVCTALGKSLKIHRIAANFSQEKLAFEAELDRTFLSQIERGMANPSLLTLASICFALDLPFSELFASVKVTGIKKRRANNAQPEMKPVKSRLR